MAFWRQRRKLGITLPNLVRRAKQLLEAGEPVTAEAMLAGIAADCPSEQMAQLDPEFWERLLDFIERLIPLIIQLIALF